MKYIKEVKYKTDIKYRNAFDEFKSILMELPSKLLEQIAFDTKPKIEEHM